MCALTRGQTLNSQEVWVTSDAGICTVSRADLSISGELSRIFIDPLWHDDTAGSLESLGLTLPRSELTNINWTKLFQIIHQKDSDALMLILCSYSKLIKMEISVDCLTERWCVWTLQIIQNCPSLTEVKVGAIFLLEEGIKILQRSHTRPACVMRVDGFVCHKQSQKCTHYKDCQLNCNQEVMIHLSFQGFFTETLRKSLF